MLEAFTDRQGLVRRNVRVVRLATRRVWLRMWRPYLDGTTFIAITGSCGKTTATNVLGAILSEHGATRLGVVSNCDQAVETTIKHARRADRWCVQEVAAEEPGVMARRMKLLRPRIGIVTTIGSDHLSSFRKNADGMAELDPKDRIAREKGALIESLPPDGFAILNADDPRVIAMRSRTVAQVITYGRSEEADLHAFDISAAWPDRLSFKARWRGETVAVQTRLVGEMWVTSVLAAIAGAVAAGIGLREAAAAIEKIEPVFGRNSVRFTDGGPVLVCGTIKAPNASIPIDIEVLAAARAPRKTLVLGNISDYSGDGGPKYKNAARLALAAGARVIGVGKNATTIRRIAKDYAAGDVLTFLSVKEVHDFLVADCVPGEFVLLKGAASTKLERIALNWKNETNCWVEDCGKKYCDDCDFLQAPRKLPKKRAAA